MLDVLYKAEEELSVLLHRDNILEGWNSVNVNYHDPHVERVWRQWGEYRISLHCIHPCEPSKSLFHPHPWPSAMRILSGEYEMEVGYGKGVEVPPSACKIVLQPESVYEMTDPDGWHSVRPLNGPCWTVMVSGKPWNRPMNEEPKHKLEPLSAERVAKMLAWFSRQY